MPRPASEERRQQWKEAILKQRESGLSITSWCRQSQIDVHTFNYWRNKFFPKATIDRSDFKEIPNRHNTDIPNKETGILLKYQGISIHIDKHFDYSTLKQCLNALKELSC
jgi:hypothetical protein